MDEAALMGLSPTASAELQARALQYFEQLKEAPNGWQICAEVLSKGHYMENDYVRFFCFKVLEHYLRTGYVSASLLEHQQIKTTLLTWLQLQCSRYDKSFIRNKAAQVFSLALVIDYPLRWPDFFTDLLNRLSLGEAAVDGYLRVLQAVDSEVVDREIVHTPQEAERNTAIKDTMREQCVTQLVDSWYHILTTYPSQSPQLCCLCLEVVGLYISWIDINLIANDRFVTLLLQFIKAPLLRETTCDTIHEIVQKGMDPLAKTELVESFTSALEGAGVMDGHGDEEDESDFLAKVSKLVNGMGVQLISAWQKLGKNATAESQSRIMSAIERKIPPMLKFLGNEDDDVSGAVCSFAHDYVTMLKQHPDQAAKHRTNVENLLYVIIRKLKYDESYSHEHEGEEEAMFLEYRKQLKVLINNIAQLDSELYLMVTLRYVTETLGQWKTVDYSDVEVAITLVYQLAEAVPVSSAAGQMLVPGSRTSVLHQLMTLLTTCGVSSHPHQAVKLMFFETVTRYDKYFTQEPQNLTEIVASFLDERGLRNSSPAVRSRTAYLFSRIVKGNAKSHMQGYIEDILKRMQDLLTLNSPDNGCSHLLTTEDQLFIYETASVLVVHANFPPEKKQLLMKTLLAPILTKFESIFTKMAQETDEQRQLMFAECLVAAMAFASRTSKGFTNQVTMQQCGCVEAFTDALKVFLMALDSHMHRQILHAGVRQYLHRMVVCLGEEILPFIPLAMDQLLKHAEAREIHDFLPLLNQLVIKFKQTIVPFLQQVFMPVVTTIFRVLNSPSDALDQVLANDKKLLQRSYYNFILVIINNQVIEIISKQDSGNLEQVLLTVVHGAVEIPDPTAQKCCFMILKRFTELWGDGAEFPAFIKFLHERIVPACFMAPMKPGFDLNDAQTRLCLGESAVVLKTAHDKRRDEFSHFLRHEYLPSLHLPHQAVLEFCQALQQDHKTFKNYNKMFFEKAKS